MANDKIGSAHVQVYPCAYRGQVEQSGVTYLWNPESRLPTEHNITEAVNNVSTVNNGSYVISKAVTVSQSGTLANGPLVIVIHGYRFEIDDLTSIASAVLTDKTNVWASIKLIDKNTPTRTGTDYKATSLANYDGSGGALDASNLFKGLVFNYEEPQSTDNLYSLHILTRATATSATPFKVPSSSLLRLDATNIANVSGGSATTDSISEHFITDQLEVVNGGDANIADELHVGGATALGSTLGVTGKATLGDTTNKPGAEVWGNLAVNGNITVNAASIGGVSEIEAGTFTVGHALGSIKPAFANKASVGTSEKHFANSYINHTRTNQISEATSGSGITINNNITLANGADITPSTTSSSLGSAGNKFGSVFANGFTGTLYGTTHLDSTSYSTDGDGEIKNLPSGWYVVEMRNGTLSRGACFTIYVPNTSDGIGTYYSPVSDFFTTNTIETKVEYNQVKLCAESTSSTNGKISIYVGSLFGNGQTGQIKYVYQKMGSQQTYTFHLTKIGSY